VAGAARCRVQICTSDDGEKLDEDQVPPDRADAGSRAVEAVYMPEAAPGSASFPAWSLEGGREQIAQRLNDPVTWAKIKREMIRLYEARGFHDLSWGVVSSYSADKSLEGLTMKEIALKLKKDVSADAQLEVARAMMLRGAPGMIYHFISEEDIARFMRHSWISIASAAHW
jgi:hypothetical protein